MAVEEKETLEERARQLRRAQFIRGRVYRRKYRGTWMWMLYTPPNPYGVLGGIHSVHAYSTWAEAIEAALKFFHAVRRSRNVFYALK
jgi:hypothetical protein